MRVGSVVLAASAVCIVGCASDDGQAETASVSTSTTQVAASSTTEAVPTSTTLAPATSTSDVDLEVCASPSAPGLTTSALEVGGRAYPTEIYQPEGRDPGRVPAVIDLHGLDSSGPAEAALTRFRQLADREGFVVAEPSGPVGPLGVTGWEIAALDEPDRDDVGAIDQLIELLVDDQCVDPDRIFVAGYSNGGFLAAELACRPESRVAAIVAVAGFHAPQPCERHVPTLVVHGTADPIVPLGPNGVSIIVDDTTPASVRELLSSSIEQEVATSASGAGCNPPSSTELADDVTELTYEGCANGATHRLVLVEGGGHTWPGAALTADADFLGPTTMSFDATEMSWAFFAAHSTGD